MGEIAPLTKFDGSLDVLKEKTPCRLHNTNRITKSIVSTKPNALAKSYSEVAQDTQFEK